MIPRNTASAIKASIELGLEGLKAQTPAWLSEWAAEHFILAADSSHETGQWSAWSFQIGIMDFMSDDRIEELNVVKSKRVGYTKIITAFITYCIAHRRRKVAVWQPTDDDRDSFVKTEIDPVLETVKAIEKARKSYGAAKDTMAFKSFRGSALHALGGKAARAYRRITVDVSILDEWDGFDQQVEKAGDPGTLAKGRLEGAPYPKFIGGTTPRIKGLSHVEREAGNAESYMRYQIECPRCGVEHPLIFGDKKTPHGFKWTRGSPATAHHVCPHCLESITQADYLPDGKPLVGAWVCDKTGKRYGADRVWRDAAGEPCPVPRHVAVHVWSAYSPQRSWESIAREHDQAHAALKRGEDGPMKVFKNETLGETWEMQGAVSDEHVLQKRAKDEKWNLRTVPSAVLALTGAVDTQDDRLEYAVWGWAEGMESWLIDFGVVWGNPAEDSTWIALEALMAQRYTREAGGPAMAIQAYAVDTQGHHTHAVYAYVRPRQRHGVYAIRGGNKFDLPLKGKASNVDVNWKGQSHPRGVRLWEVGVDTAKDLFHGQLSLTAAGQGFVHLSHETPLEVFEQLTAEHRILVKTPTGEQYRWIKRRPRNEQLDLRNYATFAAHAIGLASKSAKAWEKLRNEIYPPDNGDAKTAAEPVPAQPKPPDRAPRPAPARAFSRQW